MSRTASGSPTSPERRLLLAGLLLGVTVYAFHALAVATVMPLMAADLEARSEYGALFAVYLLASLLGLVGGGRAVDRRGPALPFAAGSLLFAAGLVGSGLAPSVGPLLVARAVEGAGGGAISNVLYAAVQRAYDDSERPRVLAWMSAAWVLPGLAGPPLAGAVGSLWGWRWVFLGALPMVGLAAALALPALRRLAPERPRTMTPGPAAGDALALVAGVGALLVALDRPPDLAAAALALAGSGLAIVSARRLLPAGTLQARRGRPAAVAGLLVLNFAFFGAEAFLPLALVDVAGLPAWKAGAVLTCGALAWTAGAFGQARLDARTPRRRLAAVGWAAVACGVAGLVPWRAGGETFVALSWCVAGLGMGTAYTTLRLAAMADSPRGSEGGTATALGIADAVGFSIAAALGGAVVGHAERHGSALGDAVGAIWMGAAAAALLGLALAHRLGAGRPDPVPTAPLPGGDPGPRLLDGAP